MIDDYLERHAKEGGTLTIRFFKNFDEGGDFVLIKGDKYSLEFFGNLLLSISKDDSPISDFSMSPRGAGSIHFSGHSNCGFYIKKL